MNRRTSSSEDEIDRRLGGLISVGVVQSVDDAGKAVVTFGEQVTPPIDWTMVVGDVTIWLRPTVGQQVLVAAPDGDIEQAAIVGGLPSNAHPALPSGAAVVIRFKDGSTIAYDPDASVLDFDLAGELRMIAPAGVSIESDVTITGKLEVSGNIHSPATITGDTDVIAAGKSGKGHRHPAGSPLTGAPQ